jgi:hypothetical protein
MKIRLNAVGVFCVASALLGFIGAGAAVVVYETPTTIPLSSDGSFLNTDGALKLAANLAGSNTINSNIVINGITFSSNGAGSFSSGGVSMTIVADGGAVGSNAADPGYADANIGNLVRGVGTSDLANGGGKQMTMSLSGLTIGQEYRLQTIHLQYGPDPALRATTIQNGSVGTPSTNQSSVINFGASGEAGFSELTWTADANTQDFIFLSTPPGTNDFARSLINAAILHAIGTQIPNPQFETPVSVPDDAGSAVLNSGEYISAINVGQGGTAISTLNGVTFYAGGKTGNNANQNNVQTLTANGVTITITPDPDNSAQQGTTMATGVYTNTASPNEMFDVLQVGFISSFGTASGYINIEMSGLTPGKTYRMQTFHIMNTGDLGSRDMVLTDGAVTSDAFSMYYDESGTNITSAVAQAVTFTAVQTSKTFQLLPAGNDRCYINALSLFEVPADPYETWLVQYPGLGEAVDLTDNPDNDRLNNLAEWALGGDPDDADDIGLVPVYETLSDGGTTYFQYVYAKRSDAAALGLSYHVEWSDDLVSTPWASENIEIVGTNVTGGDFDYVTNRVSMDAASAQFLNLVIESN